MPEASSASSATTPPRRRQAGALRRLTRCPTSRSMTVLEGLFQIQEHQDGSLCVPLLLPGRRLRLVRHVHQRALPAGLPDQRAAVHATCITVEPMPHLPVVKDLVCDMSDFFAKYEYIKPWLIRNSRSRSSEIPQSPKQRQQARHADRLHPLRLLLQLLPLGVGRGQLPRPGGAAQGVPLRGRLARRGRARSVCRAFDNERAVYRCHTITNCVEACPKELNPTEGIQWLKRAAVRRRLFGRAK